MEKQFEYRVNYFLFALAFYFLITLKCLNDASSQAIEGKIGWILKFLKCFHLLLTFKTSKQTMTAIAIIRINKQKNQKLRRFLE